MADDRRLDQTVIIGHYWDELVRGERADAGALDPTLAETVRRLHALSTASTPGSARERARRRLLDPTEPTAGKEHVMIDTPALPRFDPNDLTPPVPWRDPSRSLPLAGLRRRWAIVGVATAALLLLALAAVWLPSRQEEPRIAAPFNVATQPTATPAADVPIFRGDPARTGIMPGPGPSESPEILWQFETGAEVDSSPAIVDGTAYFGSFDGNLYAVDVATGEERWRFVAGQPGFSLTQPVFSPTVVDGVVYVAVEGSTLYAVDADTGAERWNTPIDQDPSYSSPVVVDGVVYLAAGNAATSPAVVDGTVYVGGDVLNLVSAFDAATGEQRWQTDLQPGLTAVAADSGEQRWHFSTPELVRSSPAVVDGLVYFGDRSGSVYAVETASGRERWRFEDPQTVSSSAAVADGVVYIGDLAGALYALDAVTGALIWTVELGAEVKSSPVVADGVIYVANRNGLLFALDAADGRERWSFETGSFNAGSPAVVDGVVYIGAGDGPSDNGDPNPGRSFFALGDVTAGATPAATDS